MMRIAIIGPESTGKSALCKVLSGFFGTTFIPEVSREYLSSLGRPYLQHDLGIIAAKQSQMIDQAVYEKRELLLSDTEALTIRIWSLVKYGCSLPEIDNLVSSQKFDHYLLCKTDLDWEADPLREVPEPAKREEIFNLFIEELEKRKWSYFIVGGRGKMRSEMAINCLRQLLI